MVQAIVLLAHIFVHCLQTSLSSVRFLFELDQFSKCLSNETCLTLRLTFRFIGVSLSTDWTSLPLAQSTKSLNYTE